MRGLVVAMKPNEYARRKGPHTSEKALIKPVRLS